MPRKTTLHLRVRARLRGASMRPRPDAAENVGAGEGGEVVRGSASMRPRPDAAENGNFGNPSTTPPNQVLQ